MRTYLSAALAAVTLTLAACGTPTEPKPWPSSSVAAEVSQAAAESVAPAPQKFEWVDVSGQGRELPRDVREHTQYSADPIPGAKTLHVVKSDDSMNGCTIGPAVSRGAQRGFMTAEYCTNYKPLQYLQTMPGGGIAPWAEAAERGDIMAGDDTAVIWSSKSAAVVTRIAGTWPIAGVLTKEAVEKLVPIGSPVCEFGSASGVVCGPRLADEADMLRFDVKAHLHDSGAPVFVIDRATGSAVLIGVRAGTNIRGGSSYLDPALARLGAKALIDPGTPALTGGGFSERVVAAG